MKNVENLDEIWNHYLAFAEVEFARDWPSLSDREKDKLTVFILPLIYNDRV